MTIDNASLSPRDIMGAWIHSHEEDPNDGSRREVYRPKKWPLGPSRGRRGIELKENDDAWVQDIAPADGLNQTNAKWRLESGNVVVIVTTSGETRRFYIEEIEPDKLVLREILNPN